MHESVFFNSGLVAASEPNVAAVSTAGLYGKGIFTTLAIYDREPFLWEKHCNRLRKNAGSIGIDLADFSEAAVRCALDELLTANSVQNGRTRITFFDESAADLWPYGSGRGTSLLIMTADFRPMLESLSLTVSPYAINSTSPLAGVKSCNYLEKIIAKDEAKQRGFDEAIQLNERGEIVSGSMANVFWLKNGVLFTPSLRTGCLAGTTREFVLENADCEEVEVGIEVLRSADEIFLTSAGLGLVQVARFEDRELRRERHPLINLLSSR